MKYKLFLATLILYTNFSFAEGRHYDIYNNQELSKEIIYLITKANLNDESEFNRIKKYVQKNSERKNKILNSLILFKTDDKEEKRKIQILISKIDSSVVDLKTDKVPKNGEWSGQSGHSTFFINDHTKEYSRDEIKELAPNGIPFEYGYPNFSSFRIGEVFKLENPSGSIELDYEKMVDILITRNQLFNNTLFTNREQMSEYLFFYNARFHYSLNEDGLELIPNTVYSIIDYEIPHISKRK